MKFNAVSVLAMTTTTTSLPFALCYLLILLCLIGFFCVCAFVSCFPQTTNTQRILSLPIYSGIACETYCGTAIFVHFCDVTPCSGFQCLVSFFCTYVCNSLSQFTVKGLAVSIHNCLIETLLYNNISQQLVYRVLQKKIRSQKNEF